MKIFDRIESVLSLISPPPFVRTMIGLTLIGYLFVSLFLSAQSQQIQTLKLACDSTTYPHKAKACEELNKQYDQAIQVGSDLRAAMINDPVVE